MEFFNNVSSVTSSNFATQSFNSLKEVTKFENYKVILNNELRNSLVSSVQKYKIIDAWNKFEGGALFQDQNILNLFGQYFNETIEDADALKVLLKRNDNWFDEIFKNNLKL
jgi:hypothetical protein